MRTSLGQNRHAPEQGQGLVMTVMGATPEAVRRGFTRSTASRRRSSSGVMSQLFQRSGSVAFTRS